MSWVAKPANTPVGRRWFLYNTTTRLHVWLPNGRVKFWATEAEANAAKPAA